MKPTKTYTNILKHVKHTKTYKNILKLPKTYLNLLKPI